jgi:hypothetical protein
MKRVSPISSGIKKTPSALQIILIQQFRDIVVRHEFQML